MVRHTLTASLMLAVFSFATAQAKDCSAAGCGTSVSYAAGAAIDISAAKKSKKKTEKAATTDLSQPDVKPGLPKRCSPGVKKCK